MNFSFIFVSKFLKIKCSLNISDALKTKFNEMEWNGIEWNGIV